MKKIFCILLLSCVFIRTAFAQTEPENTEAHRIGNNSVALDLFPLFKGLIASDGSGKISYFFIAACYERLIAPHFSIGANIDLYLCSYGSGNDTINGNYFSLSAEGRYYPQSENFEKYFIGTALGFNMMSVDGKSDPEYGGFTGLIVSLKTGYKVITSKNIYMEPSMSYILSKYTVMAPTPLGWQGGFRLGYVF